MLRVNVTLPILNEEAQLASSVQRILEFVARCPQWQWEAVIADNGSTDGTRQIAARLVLIQA